MHIKPDARGPTFGSPRSFARAPTIFRLIAIHITKLQILQTSSFPFCWFDMHRPLSWGPPVQKYRLPTQIYKYSTMNQSINHPGTQMLKCSTIEELINQPHYYTNVAQLKYQSINHTGTQV